MGAKGVQNNLRILNRDVIKYIAMFTMFLNHAAHFLRLGTGLREALEDLGYFTAPVMCFFLVEGYGYTRSKIKYGLRLMVFAVISQIPFHLYFPRFSMLNMFFTLSCCFLILAARDKIENLFWQRSVCLGLAVLSAAGDWPFLAAILTLMLSYDKGDRAKMMRDYAVTALLMAFFSGLDYRESGCSMAEAVFHGSLSGLGILAAGIAVVYLYNGKRAARGRNFSKWFFYIFYPAHLFVLYLASVWMNLPVS